MYEPVPCIEKEPAKRTQIKQSKSQIDFCCHISVSQAPDSSMLNPARYKLLPSGVVYKGSRYFQNLCFESSAQSDGSATSSFYLIVSINTAVTLPSSVSSTLPYP